MSYDTVFKADAGGQDAWYKGSSVRTSAPLGACPADGDAISLFSPALIPVIAHPKVRALGAQAQRRLEAGRLEEYLGKTERVELDLVNNAIKSIIAMPDVKDDEKLDAIKIYTDEGYHVVMLLEVGGRIKRTCGIDLPQKDCAPLNRILSRIDQIGVCRHELGTIAAAIVTETLITPSLTQARDSSLLPFIERFFAQHAHDESKHHAFFSSFAVRYLGSVALPDRDLIEAIVPDIIFDFLDPNLPAVVDDMAELGFDRYESWNVITESYDRQVLQNNMLSAARACCRVFERAGLQIEEAFRRRVLQCEFFEDGF
jgi:hypothetical protein